MTQSFRVAWYRFVATFRVRWSGYLTVVLLVGLLGGLSMASIAGARRTQSSYATLMARSNSSQLIGLTGVSNPTISQQGYSPSLIKTLEHLRYVKDVKSLVDLNLIPLNAKGEPLPGTEGQSFSGSVNGEQFTQDSVIITNGHRPNTNKFDQFAMDGATARQLGLHLGQVVRFVAFSNKEVGLIESLSPEQALKKLVPTLRFRATLVSTGAVQPHDLLQDQVDQGSGSVSLFTPALTKHLLTCCVNTSISALQLVGGTTHQFQVEAEIAKALPKGLPFEFTAVSQIEETAAQTLRPESIALATFGLIAALAMLVIAGQVIGRRLRFNATELTVLRALGATPTGTALDGLVGIVFAIVAGSILAGVVAVALSPLGLLGPIRPYLPNGINVDWTIVGIGVAVALVALVTLAVGFALRIARRQSTSRHYVAKVRGSSTARVAANASMPVSVVTGIRLALEPGTGRNAVPVRSAILGTVFALMIVTSTITFGASLHTLVAKPSLYGWNWTYEMNGGGGLGDIPAAGATKLLDHNKYVSQWSGVYFGIMKIDGEVTSVMGASPHAEVSPPILSGHGFDGVDQVVLGEATLNQLHKQVGDFVEVSAGGTTTKLRIVGTSTLPTIGVGGIDHLDMGSGAILSYKLIPPSQRNLFDVPAGPNAILVRIKPGVNHRAALRSLSATLVKLGGNNNGAQAQSVQRPAQIINYGSLGSTPVVLGGALALGAVVAMELTLITSVRRRRRDLALLKILGFTRRQVAAAITWQSSVATAIGTAIGVPLGVLLGRFLWDLFAHEIYAVPSPDVPILSVALIVVSALVLANIVATIPGRVAARTPTALLLRAE
ncbi:MAG: FtsX-like permease family protein [Acidimicrobiales bacterium]